MTQYQLDILQKTKKAISVKEAAKSHLIGFLIRELGGADNVKEFSNLLRELGICDLKKDSHLELAAADGGALLSTLVSWYQLGLLPKIAELKAKFKDKEEM